MAVIDLPTTAVVNASGAATITIQPTNKRTWVISQIAVQITFVSGAAVIVRKGGFVVTPIILDTQTGTGVAAGEPPVTLRPPETVTINFTGCTVGSRVSALLLLDDGT